MKSIRKHFPGVENHIYANSASAGLPHHGLTAWRRKHDEDNLNSVRYRLDNMSIFNETRTAVGSFFNCNPASVALVQNFTLGLNMLLNGLNPKENILIVANDFPSVTWPIAKRKFKTHTITLGENFETEIFENIKEKNITAFIFSMVHWQSGVRMRMDFLSNLKAEFPDLLLLVDGTQFCGTTDFNFDASPIDIIGASAYKWMLSGYGNGFLMFKESVTSRFTIKSTGFNASDGNYISESEIRFAKQFEPGHLDILTFGSLKYSVEFLTTIGAESIENHLLKLGKLAKNEFGNIGVLPQWIVERNEPTTIFNIKSTPSLVSELTKQNVVYTPRDGRIRLSFHLYNTENEIKVITDIIKKTV